MRSGKLRRWGEGARSRFGAWRVMPALQTAARKRGSIWQAATALQNKKESNCRFFLLNGGLRRFCKCSWQPTTVLQESLAANDGFAKRTGGELFADPSLAAMKGRISRGEAPPDLQKCHCLPWRAAFSASSCGKRVNRGREPGVGVLVSESLLLSSWPHAWSREVPPWRSGHRAGVRCDARCGCLPRLENGSVPAEVLHKHPVYLS